MITKHTTGRGCVPARIYHADAPILSPEAALERDRIVAAAFKAQREAEEAKYNAYMAKQAARNQILDRGILPGDILQPLDGEYRITLNPDKLHSA